MSDRIIQVADDFWNVRGSFKAAGVVDVGTQVSLVRLGSGRFVFLDSYTLDGDILRDIEALTRGGKDVEAIINLHPFHTVHVKSMHRLFPDAELYGTARHLSLFPALPWIGMRSEEETLHEQFGEDLEFSVPLGVDFVSSNPHVHFSSVLAFHRASGTIHSDDTFNYVRLPFPLNMTPMHDNVSFHPTLAKALEKRAGAADDFRAWAEGLIDDWKEAQNLCAAHTATLLGRDNHRDPLHDRLRAALDRVEPILRRHQERYG
jgi:hypothetical protein